MTISEIERIIKNKGAKEIDNSTQLGTYVIIEADKLMTKGVANRDNARWKRAQYIIIETCFPSNVTVCLNGFLQFSEYCQFLIIANLNLIYKGNGKQIDLATLTNI